MVQAWCRECSLLLCKRRAPAQLRPKPLELTKHVSMITYRSGTDYTLILSTSHDYKHRARNHSKRLSTYMHYWHMINANTSPVHEDRAGYTLATILQMEPIDDSRSQ